MEQDVVEHSYYLNGEQPAIVGCICTAFHLEQFAAEGMPIVPANVAYFQFPCGWVRLYFDGATIFWRDEEQLPEIEDEGAENFSVMVDAAAMGNIVGATLTSITYWGEPDAVGANLHFSSGTVLRFRHQCLSDVTFVSAVDAGLPD